MQKIIGLLVFVFGTAHAEVGVVADVKLSPMGSFQAKSKDVIGHAVLNGSKVEGEKIVVKLKDFKTGKDMRDEHMTKKYLQVEKYPEAVLIIGSGENGKGKGKLKMRGIEKNIEGTYVIKGEELTADFPIKISEFGITGVKYMGVGVSDQVMIHVTVPVKKKGAAQASAK